ncbi:MAG: TerC family protein [Ignavibacteriota bacterium]
MPLSHILTGIFSIVFIDLLLAGDNALIIAMAVRSLPPRERRIGTLAGAGAAVLLRVGLTFVAAKLLDIEFLKLAGGLFVVWIAVKVLLDASDPPETVAVPKKLTQAIWYIVFADVTMSTDNILAIAGASNGHIELIVFGLALSIPFVVLSANLLANLLDKYPIMIYIGSGNPGPRRWRNDPHRRFRDAAMASLADVRIRGRGGARHRHHGRRQDSQRPAKAQKVSGPHGAGVSSTYRTS